MKKLFAFVALMLSVFMAFALSGCAKNNPLPIEQMSWSMTTIQRSDDGTVLFCSESNRESYPDATVKSISCSFDDVKIIVTNCDTEQKWIGTYRVKSYGEKRTTIYEVTFEKTAENVTGNMVSSMTEYYDGSLMGTLIVSYGDYCITFSAELIN